MGSNPTFPMPTYLNWIESHASNVKVAGSSPAVGILDSVMIAAQAEETRDYVEQSDQL